MWVVCLYGGNIMYNLKKCHKKQQSCCEQQFYQSQLQNPEKNYDRILYIL